MRHSTQQLARPATPRQALAAIRHLAMPKKGERTNLSNEEIIGAVTYMIEQVAK